MKKIKCKCCGKEAELKEYTSFRDLYNIGWEVAFDASNGLTTLKVCPECSNKIQNHIRVIEDMFKIPFWKLNIPPKEKRYEG